MSSTPDFPNQSTCDDRKVSVPDARRSAEYASKADPTIKQVVIAYDDNEGSPVDNDSLW